MTPLALHRLLGACLNVASDAIAVRALHSGPPWPALLETANAAYLTPPLYAALARMAMLDSIPADVRDYLAALAERNALRNRRLKAQAAEAITALNRAGIVPVLLKGAGLLFERAAPHAASRMVTDLDILVPRAEGARAVATLAGLGYRRIESRAPAPHTLGDFMRTSDAGAIDLHVDLLTQPHLLPVADVLGRATYHIRGDLTFRRLAPADQVLHLLLHDLVQDHGLHDGRLNFRHVHELAVALAAPASIDWRALGAVLSRHRLRHALDLWLLAAAFFFAAPRPTDLAPSMAARLLFWRSLLQLRYPELARPGEMFGNVHRSLSWYRLPGRDRGLPRLRRTLVFFRTHRARTASRLLHVVTYHRTESTVPLHARDVENRSDRFRRTRDFGG